MGLRFLSGEWRKIFIAHYPIEPDVLQPFIPGGTELNFFHGQCYVSLFAFAFLHAKVFGIPVPFHQELTEINLRFYVRSKKYPDRQGVVFIREFIHKTSIRLMANLLYGEKYETVPSEYEWKNKKGLQRAEYSWMKHRWNVVQAKGAGTPALLDPGSVDFALSHQFWGFTKKNTRTICYRVIHPPWKFYPLEKYRIKVSFGNVFHPAFKQLRLMEPSSVLFAEGSEFAIYTPETLPS